MIKLTVTAKIICDRENAGISDEKLYVLRASRYAKGVDLKNDILNVAWHQVTITANYPTSDDPNLMTFTSNVT